MAHCSLCGRLSGLAAVGEPVCLACAQARSQSLREARAIAEDLNDLGYAYYLDGRRVDPRRILRVYARPQ